MKSEALKVFEEHGRALAARDLDAVVAGYAEDAVMVDTDRIGRGHDHVRAVFSETMDQAMDLSPEITVLEDGDVVFVSWRARREGQDDIVGAETFVITDGRIAVHTSTVTVSSGEAPGDLGASD
jgi:ketosteroid isomerase-like protein